MKLPVCIKCKQPLERVLKVVNRKFTYVWIEEIGKYRLAMMTDEEDFELKCAKCEYGLDAESSNYFMEHEG